MTRKLQQQHKKQKTTVVKTVKHDSSRQKIRAIDLRLQVLDSELTQDNSLAD